MANNELFYRAAREALGDDTCISGLVIDLNLAVESYLQAVTEDGIVSDRVKDEIEHGYIHALRFIEDLHGWKEFVYPGGERDAA